MAWYCHKAGSVVIDFNGVGTVQSTAIWKILKGTKTPSIGVFHPLEKKRSFYHYREKNGPSGAVRAIIRFRDLLKEVIIYISGVTLVNLEKFTRCFCECQSSKTFSRNRFASVMRNAWRPYESLLTDRRCFNCRGKVISRVNTEWYVYNTSDSYGTLCGSQTHCRSWSTLSDFFATPSIKGLIGYCDLYS